MKIFILIAKYTIFTSGMVLIMHGYNIKNDILLLIGLVIVCGFLIKQMWICNKRLIK
jgi:hypothetical protein